MGCFRWIKRTYRRARSYKQKDDYSRLMKDEDKSPERDVFVLFKCTRCQPGNESACLRVDSRMAPPLTKKDIDHRGVLPMDPNGLLPKSQRTGTRLGRRGVYDDRYAAEDTEKRTGWRKDLKSYMVVPGETSRPPNKYVEIKGPLCQAKGEKIVTKGGKTAAQVVQEYMNRWIMDSEGRMSVVDIFLDLERHGILVDEMKIGRTHIGSDNTDAACCIFEIKAQGGDGKKEYST